MWGAVCPLQRQEASRTVVVDGDVNVEPHPLWEYPCVALSNTFTVLEFDFTLPVPEEEVVLSGTVGISDTRCVGECADSTSTCPTTPTCTAAG